MRTLAIGDIHGCRRALVALCDAVDLQSDDVLITLGDYVDRGPDSKGVLDYLVTLQGRCKTIHLKGNHEELMELAQLGSSDWVFWCNVGGLSTMLSFDCHELKEIDDKYWKFFTELKLYHETQNHIFVHGGLKPKNSLEDQEEEDLLWMRFGQLKAHESGKTIVCGHTPQRDHQILDVGHAICIDTHAFADGWLTCLDVETGDFWQANDRGKTRKGRIVFQKQNAGL